MSAVPQSRIARMARVTAAGLRRAIAPHDGAGVSEILGELRGLPAKLGQWSAYTDGLIPADEAARWQPALGRLFAEAPRSPWPEVRRVLEEDLGGPGRFHRFEEEPFASASIGQVHRAQLADGREVAVKVQHPGLREAMESDLANITLLGRFAEAAGGERVHARALLRELSDTLRSELDYRNEARNQEQFRAFFAGDPDVHIPEVLRSHSGPRVLTTELAAGCPFAEATAAPEPARAAWCRTLWRFVYRGTLRGAVFNADPHPGNYRFHADGRVSFLDFGCVVRLSEAHRAADEALHRAALARDDAAFAEAAGRLFGCRGAQRLRVTRQLRLLYEPLFQRPFRITRGHAAQLAAAMREHSRAARRSAEPLAPLPEGALWMNRLQFGFTSVLARLDAEVDYAAVELDLLEAP